MRIYIDFKTALNEIRRDVGEMGLQVHAHTWQDKVVKDDPQFKSLELQNYDYCVTNPRVEDLNPTQPWADAEWEERVEGIMGNPINPGIAWKLREEVWSNFLTPGGVFGYSYAERFAYDQQVLRIIDRLESDPDSRQCFISIWRPDDICNLGGISRVPCSLGYQIQIRGGTLNLTYIQRSSDLATHFENDIYLAFRMQQYIANSLRIPVGRFTHNIFSLHLFRKDAEGIF